MALLKEQYEILKRVDDITNNIVYGYIHELEKVQILSTNIPVSIIQICVLFFFQSEYFEKAGQYIAIIGDDRDILKKNESNFYLCSACGANWIPSHIPNIIKWKFKFIENPRNAGVIIGIVAKEPDVNKGKIWENKDLIPSYIFASGGSIWINGIHEKNYPELGKHGSILTMQLNLKKGTLTFNVDNKSLGIAAENIKINPSIKYKLIVSLYYQDTTMKMTDYQVESQ